MNHFIPLRATVRAVLERPERNSWSIQGFGMLRTYLDPQKRWRLNIWHSRFAVPGVSIIHDHPWDFTSWVISGRFQNVRYIHNSRFGTPYNWMVIKTGEGGGPDGGHGEMRLREDWTESYQPGDTYRQSAEEIHASLYEDGTVTLNDRRRRPDGEHARVFWPDGTEWVDAEPRQATPDEVAEITQFALSRFGD